MAIASDQAQWQALWSHHTSSDFPPPPLPLVDFTTSFVVAVFAGTRLTTGYDLDIDAVSTLGTTIHVETTETQPGPTCITGDAMTWPFHIVTVPVWALWPTATESRSIVVDPCL